VRTSNNLCKLLSVEEPGMKNRYRRMPGYALLILIAFSLLLTSCRSMVINEPSFTLKRIGVSPRSLNDIGVMLYLDVHNPNPFDIQLKSFEYTIYLNEEEFGNGRLEKSIMAASSATTPLQVPVNVGFTSVLGGLKAIVGTGNLPYRITGKASVATSFGALNYDFSQEGKMFQK
jgi:LEA14-like dessication related protein